MSVLERWECLSWMGWVNWRVWWLDSGVSESAIVNEAMVHVEWWIVLNSNPLQSTVIPLMTITYSNWNHFPLSTLLMSSMAPIIESDHSHWLVCLVDWFEFSDLPQLQSVKLGDEAFRNTKSFKLSNLPSLQSIGIGEDCFEWAPSFSLTSLIDWMDWILRSSSVTICQTWWICIPSCSIGCVWEWLNGWIDDSDLPKLQSVKFGSYAFEYVQSVVFETISKYPYGMYKKTLTMRSDIGWTDEWIDLPSLTSFKGDEANFYAIGSVILESSDLVIDWTRYPSVIILGNPIRWWLLPVHLFPPILKYAFSHLIIIRCYCSRIIHQKQKQISLILIPSVSLNFHW